MTLSTFFDVTRVSNIRSGGSCCCCSHINSHNQVRGHRTGSSHSGDEEYPREKTQTNPRWLTHISQLTQFMTPPRTYKSEIGSQPTMCQVHTGAYVSLLAPGKTDYTATTQERLSRIYCTSIQPPRARIKEN